MFINLYFFKYMSNNTPSNQPKGPFKVSQLEIQNEQQQNS